MMAARATEELLRQSAQTRLMLLRLSIRLLLVMLLLVVAHEHVYGCRLHDRLVLCTGIDSGSEVTYPHPSLAFLAFLWPSEPSLTFLALWPVRSFLWHWIWILRLCWCTSRRRHCRRRCCRYVPGR